MDFSKNKTKSLLSWNICLFLMLFFVDVTVAKSKLVISPLYYRPVDIGEIVTFSCEYGIPNVQVIEVYSGNTILITWKKGAGYTTVKKRIITIDFNPDSGVFNMKLNVSLCYEQLYYCRAYDESLSSEESEKIGLTIVNPKMETLLNEDNPQFIEIKNMNSTNPNNETLLNEDNPQIIEIKNMTSTNPYNNFSCSFDNVKNAVSIIVSSENSSLIIEDVHSSINHVEEECRWHGFYNSKLQFEAYGDFVITCTVNTTDSKISHSMEYKVTIVENLDSFLPLWKSALVGVGALLLCGILVVLGKLFFEYVLSNYKEDVLTSVISS